MNEHSYIALCGGVGGSRLADGLARSLPAGKLTIVVNTGDDFDHLGLRICPDLDTVTYMLSGLVDEVRGWGRGDESWAMMETMTKLGGPSWFNLGDRDLALHLLRTKLLREGVSLTFATRQIADRLGARHSILPMTEDAVRTILHTTEGKLSFQEYFVGRRCEPVVIGFDYEGASAAVPPAALIAAFADPSLRGILIAPSNPFLSIAPILAVRGIREALDRRTVPIAAMSPLVGRKAVKGPLSKLLAELGFEQGADGILAFYGNLIDGLVIDERDEYVPAGFSKPALLTADTLMQDSEARARVARFALSAIEKLHRH